MPPTNEEKKTDDASIIPTDAMASAMKEDHFQHKEHHHPTNVRGVNDLGVMTVGEVITIQQDDGLSFETKMTHDWQTTETYDVASSSAQTVSPSVCISGEHQKNVPVGTRSNGIAVGGSAIDGRNTDAFEDSPALATIPEIHQEVHPDEAVISFSSKNLRQPKEGVSEGAEQVDSNIMVDAGDSDTNTSNNSDDLEVEEGLDVIGLLQIDQKDYHSAVDKDGSVEEAKVEIEISDDAARALNETATQKKEIEPKSNPYKKKKDRVEKALSTVDEHRQSSFSLRIVSSTPGGQGERRDRVSLLICGCLCLLLAGVAILVAFIFRDIYLPDDTAKSYGDCAFETLEELAAAVSLYTIEAITNVETSICAGSPIGSWDVSRVEDFNQLFAYDRDPLMESFNEDISAWNTSKVRSMASTFGGAKNFAGNLNSWDVSKVTKMSRMFAYAHSFDGDISAWDVSEVIDMTSMFHSATSFKGNGNLSNWDVSNVRTFDKMFEHATAFEGSGISSWYTKSAVSMERMFYRATNFNVILSHWQIRRVLDFDMMFFGASSFSQDLCPWGEEIDREASVQNMFQDSACQAQSDPILSFVQVEPLCAMCRHDDEPRTASEGTV